MNEYTQQLQRNRILRLQEVVEITGLSKATLYRYMGMNPPRFPPSIKIGISAIGFKAEAIALWIAEREIESTTINTIH